MAPFLALYLLILAFFVVLNALSVPEARRTESVLVSLDATFRPAADPRAGGPVVVLTGSVVAATRSFHDTVRLAVETTFPAARLHQRADGAVLEANFRADQLFADGATAVRPPAVPFLDRLVAALGAAPPGLVYEMELILGTDYDSIGTPPDGPGAALAVARAGAFARLMLARGAPPEALAVGLDPHPAGDGDAGARLLFRVVEASGSAATDAAGRAAGDEERQPVSANQ